MTEPIAGSSDIGKPAVAKAYLEHLRSVHFALTALSFGMLAAGVLAKRPEVTAARTQLATITEILRGWDEAWLQKHFDSLLGLDTTLMIRRDAHPDLPLVLGRSWALRHSDQQLATREGLRHRFLMESPPSLSGFVALWEKLDRVPVYRAHAFPDSGYVRGWTAPRRKLDLESAAKEFAQLSTFPKPWRRVTLFLQHVDDLPGNIRATRSFQREMRDSFDFALFAEGLAREMTPVQLLIPLEIEADTYNAQRALTNNYLSKPRTGPFSETFPELSRLTAVYADLPLAKIDTILAAEEQRSDDRIEVLETKIPLEALAALGIPVLLGFQLYFFLHLTAMIGYLGKDVPSFETPWIGIYESPTARVATFASVAAFPASVALLLAVNANQGGRGGPSDAFIAAGAIGSIALAVLSTVSLRRLWLSLGGERANTAADTSTPGS